MKAVFDESRFVNNKFGGEYQLTIHGSRDKLFQDWVRQSPDAALWTYFSSLCKGIIDRQLHHYHLKICNGRYDTKTRSQLPSWKILILYGQDTEEGPLQMSRCMSCDLDCPLVLGVLGQAAAAATNAVSSAAATLATAPEQNAAHTTNVSPQQSASVSAGDDASAAVPAAETYCAPTATETQAQTAEGRAAPQNQRPQQQQQSPVSRDSLLQETEHNRVWLDAKARPMFIITPKRHVEQLSDLSEAEVVDLFRTAAATPEVMGCHNVQTMVLNQGDNRNHAHLHLKIRIHEREFEKAAVSWSAEHMASLMMMRDFRDSLPPENRGTKEAFLLRQNKKQQQPQLPPGRQQAQFQQRREPWKQQRPY